MPALRRRAGNITPILAAAAAACAAGATTVLPADARPAAEHRQTVSSELLWATVNVCDSDERPNTVGIRASMPGSGVARERMFARFRVQYLSMVDSRWHDLGPGGDSGWVALGSARHRARQAGRDFILEAPEGGATYRVRGLVTYEWRRGDRVVRRARRRTEGGHPGTRGASPADFSAASCVIK